MEDSTKFPDDSPETGTIIFQLKERLS